MKAKRDGKMKWGRIAVYLTLLMLVIVAMIGLKYMSRKGAMTNAGGEKADTIHAAVVYGPNSYRVLISDDGNDSITGINYHLLKDIEKHLGIKVMLYPVIDRDEALAKVGAGRYDILASLPADNHIKQKYLTTEEVYLDRMVLLQKKNANGLQPARSALDLEGDTVHVEKGSAAVRRLENLQKEIGGKIEVIEEPELSEEYLAMKVATGEWKYTVVNEKIAEQMQAQYPDLDFSTPVSFTQFQVWILPQGRDSLLQRVNKFLSDIK